MRSASSCRSIWRSVAVNSNRSGRDAAVSGDAGGGTDSAAIRRDKDGGARDRSTGAVGDVRSFTAVAAGGRTGAAAAGLGRASVDGASTGEA